SSAQTATSSVATTDLPAPPSTRGTTDTRPQEPSAVGGVLKLLEDLIDWYPIYSPIYFTFDDGVRKFIFDDHVTPETLHQLLVKAQAQITKSLHDFETSTGKLRKAEPTILAPVLKKQVGQTLADCERMRNVLLDIYQTAAHQLIFHLFAITP